MILTDEIWGGRAEITKDCLQTFGSWLFYLFLVLLAFMVLVVIVACVWKFISHRNDYHERSCESDWQPTQGVPQDDHWSAGMFG